MVFFGLVFIIMVAFEMVGIHLAYRYIGEEQWDTWEEDVAQHSVQV